MLLSGQGRMDSTHFGFHEHERRESKCQRSMDRTTEAALGGNCYVGVLCQVVRRKQLRFPP